MSVASHQVTRRLRTAVIALMIIAVLALMAAPFLSAGQFHDQKQSQRIAWRPAKWQWRGEAGYPWGQAAANATGLATGIPIGLAFKVLTWRPGAARPSSNRSAPCTPHVEEYRCRPCR